MGGAAVGGTAAAASKTPCKPGGSPAGGSVKRVWRHLRNGDALLLNRQPTLHKPGIMAHVCKVLRGEKVIRMHYANCNTYNADFDGDEMNVHMCQTELARAEAYEIAATDEQHIAPTNGKPLRGIIQDHVVAGVYLTKRDTFMDRSLFVQLLQLANMDLCHHSSRVARLPAPAILKPQTPVDGQAGDIAPHSPSPSRREAPLHAMLHEDTCLGVDSCSRPRFAQARGWPRRRPRR